MSPSVLAHDEPSALLVDRPSIRGESERGSSAAAAAGVCTEYQSATSELGIERSSSWRDIMVD